MARDLLTPLLVSATSPLFSFLIWLCFEMKTFFWLFLTSVIAINWFLCFLIERCWDRIRELPTGSGLFISELGCMFDALNCVEFSLPVSVCYILSSDSYIWFLKWISGWMTSLSLLSRLANRSTSLFWVSSLPVKIWSYPSETFCWMAMLLDLVWPRYFTEWT